jgi:nicotinamidase/pyrazinamidase
MTQRLFWDVDTQYDFMISSGKLYVPHAEDIIPTLKSITQYARKNQLAIWGSVDSHDPKDPEFSSNPDFQETFPPHCIKGTVGDKKIKETTPLNPLWIESKEIKRTILEKKLKKHNGEVFFRKNQFDVFTNPNVIPAILFLKPEEIFVYGVALDVCNAYAIEGFLRMKKSKIYLIEDASKPIHPKKGSKLISKWKSQGVKILKVKDVIV